MYSCASYSVFRGRIKGALVMSNRWFFGTDPDGGATLTLYPDQSHVRHPHLAAQERYQTALPWGYGAINQHRLLLEHTPQELGEIELLAHLANAVRSDIDGQFRLADFHGAAIVIPGKICRLNLGDLVTSTATAGYPL